jgi:hypothetical protein
VTVGLSAGVNPSSITSARTQTAMARGAAVNQVSGA